MSMIGKSLLHYEISAQIGRGGMGEVYQAKDTKLGRDVAIKVLPEEFARDADRVARFQREAKLLASLNHPNIAAIHGLEESEGTHFLVLELIEGQSLADRIKTGPILVEEALKIALQIAEALEAAHENGVIHRDLKPSNIKVTPDGKVKVLDFGLAKAYAGDQGNINLPDSPTISAAATQQGVILGTAAYMSPEQARGKPVDKRTDIWAFAVVLYEMLTGKAAFSGGDITDTLAAVIRSEPEWKSLPANLHWRLKELLERCLEKEAKDRYGSISDARVDIQKVLADPSGLLVQSITAAEPQTRARSIIPWIVAILGIVFVGAAVWYLRAPEPRQVMRFDYELPKGQEFSSLNYQNLAVSPDGKQVVYSTLKGLYIRSLDALTSKLISGTEEYTATPFFSPDGKWIGYFSMTDLKLKKITLSGGVLEDLCDILGPGGAWCDENNTIVYGQDDIMRISADGGTPESIVKQKSGRLTHPQILPDGKSILYTSNPNNAQPKIMVQFLKSGEAKELFPGFNARYVPTGHILYMLPNNNNLFAVQFDLAGLNVKGQRVSVLEGLVQYAISGSGTLAYIPVTSSPDVSKRTLVWVNREGKEEPLSAPPNEYFEIRISPDGNRLALQAATPKNNILIWDIVRKAMMPLTFDEGAGNTTPLWTPDGKRILYTSDPENVLLGSVHWKASDGTGEVEKLASSPGRGLLPFSWSRDGKTLVLWEVTLNPVHLDIGIVSMEGDHARRELLHERYDVKEPAISPNGSWMAYASNESGKYEVYVCPFPDVNKGKWKVSTTGGNHPLWSPDGRELFYNNGDATMAVPVETERQFKYGTPSILFRGTAGKIIGPVFMDVTDYTYWDISPDGKRFLMLKDDPAQAPRKINIVVNWFEELKQKVPVD